MLKLTQQEFDELIDKLVGCKIKDVERALTYATLKFMNGNKYKTATALGMHYTTLMNRLSVYETKMKRNEQSQTQA